MKNLILIIVFSLSIFVSNAQTYFADDACWTEFTVNIFTNSVENKSQYYLDGDTLLNDKTYKKVVNRFPNYYIGAIREEAGKVFKQYTDYETMVDGEFLLYDFTVKVGDTIYSTSPSGELSQKPVVTKIDTVELLIGEKRKRFFFDKSLEKIWIEGIGSIGGLFSEAYEHPTNGRISHLVCFKNDGIEYFKNSSLCPNGDCCDLLTAVYNPKSLIPTTVLSPNPTNRFVRLDFSKTINSCKSVKLLNALGSELYKSTSINQFNFELDLMNYSSGLYFVVVEFEKDYEIHKVIKQ